MKMYRANDFWERSLNKKDLYNLFSSKLSQEDKMNLFKEFVEVVNLETTTQCNRHCSYCPLAKDDRGMSQVSLKDSIFEKILLELSAINYNGLISLNLYNEPLLDKNLEEKIIKIRSKLPNCFISFNSNGDYLTKERLLKLEASGVNEIRVTLHRDKYEDNDRKKAIKSFFNKIELNYEINKFVEKKLILVEKKINTLNLIVMCTNWGAIGNDRAGSINILSITNVRKKPCMKPFREIVITAEGDSFPCCNFFPNTAEAKRLTIGNLIDSTIYDIFTSNILVGFRKNLFDFSEKLSPCNTCNDIDNSNINTDEKRKEILNKNEL